MTKLTPEGVKDLKFEHDEKHYMMKLLLPDEKIASIVYQKLGPNNYKFGRTEVPDEFEGLGVASRLATEVFTLAKKNNWKLTLACSYLSSFVAKKPEFQDLISSKL
jgi:predicted GNAT family acetyltransferase